MLLRRLRSQQTRVQHEQLVSYRASPHTHQRSKIERSARVLWFAGISRVTQRVVQKGSVVKVQHRPTIIDVDGAPWWITMNARTSRLARPASASFERRAQRCRAGSHVL